MVKNPMVTAYGLGYKVVVRLPLSEIQGMAYGVREDIERGKHGLIPNQCSSQPYGVPVVAWEVVDLEGQFQALAARFDAANRECLLLKQAWVAAQSLDTAACLAAAQAFDVACARADLALAALDAFCVENFPADDVDPQVECSVGY